MTFPDPDPSPAVAQKRFLHTLENGGKRLTVALAGCQDGGVESVTCQFHRQLQSPCYTTHRRREGLPARPFRSTLDVGGVGTESRAGEKPGCTQ